MRGEGDPWCCYRLSACRRDSCRVRIFAGCSKAKNTSLIEGHTQRHWYTDRRRPVDQRPQLGAVRSRPDSGAEHRVGLLARRPAHVRAPPQSLRYGGRMRPSLPRVRVFGFVVHDHRVAWVSGVGGRSVGRIPCRGRGWRPPPRWAPRPRRPGVTRAALPKPGDGAAGRGLCGGP